MPVFKVHEISHATEIKGVRYFTRVDERELILRYGWEADFWNWAPTPDGFELSPQQVAFIYGLFLNGQPIKNYDLDNIFFDTNNYYLAKSCEIYTNYKSLIADTTTMDGRDGRIYNSISNIWENLGYIHLSYPEVADQVRLGASKPEVVNHLGRAFNVENPPRTLFLMQNRYLENPTNNLEALDYWCRDGHFILLFEDGQVTSVITNITMGYN